MQDCVRQLLTAINQYNPDDPQTIDHLRDLVCWISDSEDLKQDPIVANLLYTASQKMRVFGYNALNNFSANPDSSLGMLGDIGEQAIKNLYQSEIDSTITLDKSQKEVLDLFQSISPRRLLVSAPTSYGKTFLMREIIFHNRDRYKNIILVFPTVALLLENAGVMSWFVKKNNLNYRIIKTVDSACEEEGNKIFVFTPERALQLISSFPDLKIDFFFFDEVYKIDEDFSNEEHDDNRDESGEKAAKKNRKFKQEKSFLDEDRGKTFRIALYLLSKSVEEYYIAGPNLSQDHFGLGMRRYIELNHITVKEIAFEPTLRISVNAYNSKICEQLPDFLPMPATKELVRVSANVSEKINDVVTYIKNQDYGQTLLYCKSPAKAIEYSDGLSNGMGNPEAFDSYPDEFKRFIDHIRKEYDINNSVNEWSLIKILKNGFGMHHGQLPKYIQREILEQFNTGLFQLLFCTSTIVEGVNTDARNMVILNPSKGSKKLSPFDIKNIKGRAGRYHHCFVGRVFYMSRELTKIEESDPLVLDFVTYSDVEMGPIDLDNAERCDLTPANVSRKNDRERVTSKFRLPNDVFIKNRTIPKECQEKLLTTLMNDQQYADFHRLVPYTVDVESFWKYSWMWKILQAFQNAGLLSEYTVKNYYAVSRNYYEKGFKGILEHKLKQCKNDKNLTIDKAYTEAFRCLRGTLEHRIPKILALFESIIMYVAQEKGDDTSNFSLSRVCRYYETGVKSPLGEALAEYGFPTDAIRRLEDRNHGMLQLDVAKAKQYCRDHYQAITPIFDEYENQLFVKAMNTFK